MVMLYGSGTLHISQIYTHFRPRPRRYSLTPFRCYIGTPSLQSRSYTPRLLVEKPSLAKNILLSVTIALGAGLGYLYITDTRASVHRWLAVPLVRAIWPDAEDAHQAGVKLLKELHRFGLHPRERGHDAKDLEIDVFGHTLVNPLGISSGLDKNGEIPTPLLALGPAVVEIGGVTETRQSGNPRPRLFRIVSQQGMLNRYGLNSDGAELVAARLRQRLREFADHQGYGLGEEAERFVLNGDAGVPPGSLVKGKLMAIQVAKNASTPDGDIEAIRRDYIRATSLLARYADIVVVNVSCPNAPGYRELQQIEPLTKILTGVVGAAASADRKSRPAIMVKVSPDEDTEEQVASICAAVWASGVDGVIVGNSTRLRMDALPETSLSKTEAAIMREQGGYSGPQLFHRTVDLVKKYRRILDYPLYEKNKSQQAQLQPQEATGTRIEASIEHDASNLEDASNESVNQHLIRIPERYSTSTTGSPGSDTPALSALRHLEQSSTSKVSPATLTPKVIFCTGGITNGQQAIEVLIAGASVAQIYTGMCFYLKMLPANDWHYSTCLRRGGKNHLYEAGDEANMQNSLELDE